MTETRLKYERIVTISYDIFNYERAFLSLFNHDDIPLQAPLVAALSLLLNCQPTGWHLTCYGVGGCGASGGAGGADHAGVTAAGSTDAAGAGAAVAAPLPALPGAAGPLPGAVLSDVVAHLMTSHGSKISMSRTTLMLSGSTWSQAAPTLV